MTAAESGMQSPKSMLSQKHIVGAMNSATTRRDAEMYKSLYAGTMGSANEFDNT